MGLRVLVVDDSEVMRQVIARTMRLGGLPLDEVYEAENGVAAVALLKTRPVDLMLVDINMPVMDGEELIRHVRADAAMAEVPVVVVTAAAGEPRLERLTLLNVGFVQKPFTPESLASAAQLVLGLREEQLRASRETGPGGEF